MSFFGKTSEASLQSNGFALSPYWIDKLEVGGIVPSATIAEFRQGVADNQGYGISVLTAHKGRGIAALRKTILHEPQHVLQDKYPLPEEEQKSLADSFESDTNPKINEAWWRFKWDMESRPYPPTQVFRELAPRIASGQYRDRLMSLDHLPTMDDETAEAMFTRYAEAVLKHHGGEAAAEVYRAAPYMHRLERQKAGLSNDYYLADITDDGQRLFFPKHDVDFNQLLSFPEDNELPPSTPPKP